MKIKGIIIEKRSAKYIALCNGKTFALFFPKSALKKYGSVLVGDYVKFEDDKIIEVLPRKTVFNRPNIANAEAVFIVVAPIPKPDYILVDKLLFSIRKAGAEAFIIVNKIDLGEELYSSVCREYRDAVSDVLPVSAATGEGMDKLLSLISGRLVAFAGQSAVGKTSLQNKIFSSCGRVGEVQERTLRGRHTTTRSIIVTSGNMSVIDTPGFSEIDAGVDLRELESLYPEFDKFRAECYYKGCLHDSEPNCAVKQAVAGGEIPAQRYERYIKIYRQMKEESRYAKR